MDTPHQMVDQMVGHFIFIRLGGCDYPGKIYLQYAYICFIFSFSRYSAPGAVWLGMVLAINHSDRQKAF